jgi:hypothetical protein
LILRRKYDIIKKKDWRKNMQDNLQLQYDSICYHTFHKVRIASKGASRICFSGFDAKNKEHMFVIAVTVACLGLLDSKDIAIDAGFITRARLNKKYKKVCRFKKINKKDLICIDIDGLLEDLRGLACEICGENFRFGDIYDAYYAEETR